MTNRERMDSGVKTKKTLIDPALPCGVGGWFAGDDLENYSRNGNYTVTPCRRIWLLTNAVPTPTLERNSTEQRELKASR